MGIIEKIHHRLQLCDKIQGENIKLIKNLKNEAERKSDHLGEKIIKLSKKLEKDPGNKQLQNEYAGHIMAKQMFSAGHKLNEALLKNND